MNVTILKPIIKRVTGKNNRAILTKVLSNEMGLNMTDLETYVTLKNVALPHGLLDVESLGLTNKVSELDIADYPIFPVIKTNNSIKVSIKTIELLLESASDDETRLYLNGIAWVKSDLVSTNGHILTRISEQSTNSLDRSIMPRTSLKELVNLSKKFKVLEVNIEVSNDFFKVDNEFFTLMGRIINRKFPRYQSAIPVKTTHELVINNSVEYKTVKDILNRNNSVKIENESGKSILTVENTDFKIEVGTSDFKGTIGFNLKYLNFLTRLDSKIKFNNELSPVLVTSGNITRIAMPLKV